MTREHQLEAAGERLSVLISKGVMALMHNDQEGAWQALDVEGAVALREWDRLMGREVPSEEELLANQAKLLADVRAAVAKINAPPLSELG